MSDIVERLRQQIFIITDADGEETEVPEVVAYEAADLIESQAARIAELEAEVARKDEALINIKKAGREFMKVPFQGILGSKIAYAHVHYYSDPNSCWQIPGSAFDELVSALNTQGEDDELET